MFELKSCPFCGKEQDILFTRELANTAHIKHICEGCGAEGPVAPSHEAATAFWNARAERVCTMEPCEVPIVGWFSCSACGAELRKLANWVNFCPACGARIERSA